MKRNIYFLVIILLLLQGHLNAQQSSQNRVMEANNEVVLNLLGVDKDYSYRSGMFSGRYDKENQQFIFVLPVQSIYPLNDSMDISVLNELLISNRVGPAIQITARFNEALVNIKDFKAPTEVLLDGTISLYNTHYNVPVTMSLFYNNEVLFYKISLELDYYKSKWKVPVHQRKFLAGIMQLHVVDGKWRNFLN